MNENDKNKPETVTEEELRAALEYIRAGRVEKKDEAPHLRQSAND